MLESDSRDFRIVAVRSVGDIGSRNAAPSVIALLEREEDPGIIAHAAVALALMGAEEAVGPLLSALDRVESPVARRQVLNAAGNLIGESDGLYPMLAMNAFELEEAVSRMLKDLSRIDGAGRGFGARRMRSVCEHAQQDFVAGDYSKASLWLTRLASRDKDDMGAAGAVLEWAISTAEKRQLDSEEFLLALFASRQAIHALEA